MEREQIFSGTAAEWEAEQERTVCCVQPSKHSTARCEMPKGHTDGDQEARAQEAYDFLASFHAGRTRGGHWKFWEVE